MFPLLLKIISKTQQQASTRTNDGGVLLHSGARLEQYVPISLVQPPLVL